MDTFLCLLLSASETLPFFALPLPDSLSPSFPFSPISFLPLLHSTSLTSSLPFTPSLYSVQNIGWVKVLAMELRYIDTLQIHTCTHTEHMYICTHMYTHTCTHTHVRTQNTHTYTHRTNTDTSYTQAHNMQTCKCIQKCALFGISKNR